MGVQSGKSPLPAKIWQSIRHKDLSRQIKTFLWKGIYGALHSGKYWRHIPGFEDREMCQSCGVTESLEHILLECTSPGQAEVWNLAGQLWLKKHGQLPDLSLGNILGCCSTTFEVKSKSKPSGVNRALTKTVLSSHTVLQSANSAHSSVNPAAPRSPRQVR
ncbi:hypothetical protein B0H13DRAFT_1631813 [Mycena leptocephala]|nr:hypothetical protein B0H13DRAFT_1631813 [Mycena leptocephala]